MFTCSYCKWMVGRPENEANKQEVMNVTPFLSLLLNFLLFFVQFGQHLANWHRDSDRIHNRFVVCVCVCVCVCVYVCVCVFL